MELDNNEISSESPLDKRDENKNKASVLINRWRIGMTEFKFMSICTGVCIYSLKETVR